MSLPVQRKGVDDGEKQPHKRLQRGFLRTVAEADRLGKAGGVGIDLLIGGVLAPPIGIAGSGFHHPTDALEEVFHPPEAAAGQVDFLDSHATKIRIKIVPLCLS